MKFPNKSDFVEVINNKTMKVVGKGYVTEFTPSTIVIRCPHKQTFNARTHHFKGYRPDVIRKE